MVWHSDRICTLWNTEAGPIVRWFHELRCTGDVEKSFPKRVIVGQHEIQSELFRLGKDTTIIMVGVIGLELSGSGLNGGEVLNGIFKKQRTNEALVKIAPIDISNSTCFRDNGFRENESPWFVEPGA